MIFSRLIRRVSDKWFNVQEQTTQSVRVAQVALFRGGVVLISSIVIVWLSIFLYTAFYYAYMPSMLHTRPVHLQFKSCGSGNTRHTCSYPEAHVQFTKKQQLLMVGQPYRIKLHLEMPESPVNREIGMFMVCANLLSRNGYVVDDSCRSTMLHYRSTLLHTLKTFTFSPLLIFGSREEKQYIELELFSSFEEDQSHPVTSVYIRIESLQVQFYSVSIDIHAHLNGLRYLMFHWPILTAIVGISTNLFFIALVCTLSYLHFAHEDDIVRNEFKYEKGDEVEEIPRKIISETSSESSSIEDASFFEDVIKCSDEMSRGIRIEGAGWCGLALLRDGAEFPWLVLLLL